VLDFRSVDRKINPPQKLFFFNQSTRRPEIFIAGLNEFIAPIKKFFVMKCPNQLYFPIFILSITLTKKKLRREFPKIDNKLSKHFPFQTR
jgi:hypothetical protein